MGGVFSIFGITIVKENADKCLIYLFKSCFASGIVAQTTLSQRILLFFWIAFENAIMFVEQ